MFHKILTFQGLLIFKSIFFISILCLHGMDEAPQHVPKLQHEKQAKAEIISVEKDALNLINLVFLALIDNEVYLSKDVLLRLPLKDFLGNPDRGSSISPLDYLKRIVKYFYCSPACYVAAALYIKRLIERSATEPELANILNQFSFHRLFLISLVVTAKFWSDIFCDNKYYARVGGISNAELNTLEVKHLCLLQSLLISQEEYDAFVLALKQKEAVLKKKYSFIQLFIDLDIEKIPTTLFDTFLFSIKQKEASMPAAEFDAFLSYVKEHVDALSSSIKEKRVKMSDADIFIFVSQLL